LDQDLAAVVDRDGVVKGQPRARGHKAIQIGHDTVGVDEGVFGARSRPGVADDHAGVVDGVAVALAAGTAERADVFERAIAIEESLNIRVIESVTTRGLARVVDYECLGSPPPRSVAWPVKGFQTQGSASPAVLLSRGA